MKQMTVSASALNIIRAAARIRREIGQGIEYHYTLRAKPGCGEALGAILSACKIPQARREEVRAEIARQETARANRRRGAGRKPNGRSPILLHAGADTIQAHLAGIRIEAVERAAHALRANKYRIILTDDPSRIGVVYRQRSLGQYSSRCSYTHYETTLTVAAPTRWRMRVERRGLAVVDGMMTLDAAPCDYRIDGVEVFAATWAEQGRGYSATVHHGFIARSGSVACHADTAAKAIAGLRRKASWSKLDAATKQASVRHLTDWTLRAAKAPADTLVCVSDAQATGACDYGIRSWCNRVGIDYEVGCATLAEVLAGYEQYPLPEVRAAVLHAIRQARQANP